MNLIILTLSFLVAVFLESTVIRIPLVLILLLVLFVRKKTPDEFLAAFLLGIFLDIVNVRRVGITSIYFLVLLFFVFLYDRKYEINTLPFVLIASTVAIVGHAMLFSIDELFLFLSVALFFSGFLFLLLRKINYH